MREIRDIIGLDRLSLVCWNQGGDKIESLWLKYLEPLNVLSRFKISIDLFRDIFLNLEYRLV